jgi:hypothetical protein
MSPLRRATQYLRMSTEHQNHSLECQTAYALENWRAAAVPPGPPTTTRNGRAIARPAAPSAADQRQRLAMVEGVRPGLAQAGHEVCTHLSSGLRCKSRVKIVGRGYGPLQSGQRRPPKRGRPPPPSSPSRAHPRPREPRCRSTQRCRGPGRRLRRVEGIPRTPPSRPATDRQRRGGWVRRGSFLAGSPARW